MPPEEVQRQTENVRRYTSSAIYAAGVLAFLLPFCAISCPGHRQAFTGAQLLVGPTVQQPNFTTGTVETTKADPQREVQIALVFAVAAALLALLRSVSSQVLAVLSATGTATSLLIMQSEMAREVERSGEGMVSITFEAGFWLALVAMGGGAVVSLVQAARLSKARPPQPAAPRESPPEGSAGPATSTLT